MLIDFSETEYHDLLCALGRAGKGGRLSKSDRFLAARISKELAADFGAVAGLRALGVPSAPLPVALAAPRRRRGPTAWVVLLAVLILDYVLYALLVG